MMHLEVDSSLLVVVVHSLVFLARLYVIMIAMLDNRLLHDLDFHLDQDQE